VLLLEGCRSNRDRGCPHALTVSGAEGQGVRAAAADCHHSDLFDARPVEQLDQIVRDLRQAVPSQPTRTAVAGAVRHQHPDAKLAPELGIGVPGQPRPRCALQAQTGAPLARRSHTRPALVYGTAQATYPP
jgi:hypothetical protein